MISELNKINLFSIDELDDNEIFTVINFINIFLDLALIIPCLILCKIIAQGPGFVVKGLILVIASCTVDMLQ